MMLKKISVGVLALALVISAALVMTVDGSRAVVDQQSTSDTQRSIGISASGSSEMQPDIAVIRVSVTADSKDATTARKNLAESADSMRKALMKAGIPEDSVRTVSYNLYEHRDRYGEKPNEYETEYRATQSFEITLGEIDRAGEIIDVAVDGGATSVNSVTFTVSEDTRRELRSEALRDALKNARGQAKTVADASDLVITGVHSVSTSDITYNPMYKGGFGDEATSSTVINSGPITVTATVSVEYSVE